jgi:hypothetical protein
MATSASHSRDERRIRSGRQILLKISILTSAANVISKVRIFLKLRIAFV